MKTVIYGPGETKALDGCYRVEVHKHGRLEFGVDLDADLLPGAEDPVEIAIMLEEMADGFQAIADAEIHDGART